MSSSSGAAQQRARAKKAQAKQRHQQHDEDNHDARDAGEAHASGGTAGAGASAGGGASSDDKPSSYAVFDGREELLLYWQGQLTREEKEDLLHIEVAELEEAFAYHLDGARIPTEKVREIRDQAEFMTQARLLFIDAVYQKDGHVQGVDQQEPQMKLLLFAILGVIERHTQLSYERSNTLLRGGLLVFWYIWTLSTWAWWIRYPTLFLLSLACVAVSNAAAVSLTAAASTQSPFWSSVAKAYLAFKELALRPFDNGTNPVLLRARAEIFFSALIVLDLATWMPRGKYYLLVLIVAVVPTLILLFEKGQGGRNKSAEALFARASNRSADKNGMRYLRVLFIGVSNLIAIYYAWGLASWLDVLFVAFFFFPGISTILLSMGSIGIAAAFLFLGTLQDRILGAFARLPLVNWSVFLTLVAATWTGWTTSHGWLIWLGSWVGLLVFLPPLISHLMQAVFGGVCALLVSVGVHSVCQVVLQLGQLILTREGLTQLVALLKVALIALATYAYAYVKALVTGAPMPGAEEPTATDADAAGAGAAGSDDAPGQSTAADESGAEAAATAAAANDFGDMD